MTRFVLLLGIIGSSAAVLAQSATESADDRFVQVAYAKAAGAYERALTDPALLSDNERRAAKAWLAYRCQ